MEKKPVPDLSDAVKSDPAENARDVERLFDEESGQEAQEANLKMRKARESDKPADPLGGSPTAERFGSPD
ncbi:hypothetical protein JL100_026515 [Skermanella mucosa]|uniref:hypothetical protein n=1 Tax=Skermanella mucosa TaxID=1789672 RepID=UPI001E40B454|nr:hypothetical protein [Skermanella mucosa]UEM20591.1 hypothetical protein JL100_026515 [Skermanella mucosa]